MVISEHAGYAVVMKHVDGVPQYAVMNGMPATFFCRKDAVKFRNELHEHGCSRGKVVKVWLTIEEF